MSIVLKLCGIAQSCNQQNRFLLIPENCLLLRTDNAHGQKSEHINFLRQMEDIVYILYLAKETVLTLIAPKPEKQKITERNKSNLYSCCNDHDRLIKCTQELSQMRCN